MFFFLCVRRPPGSTHIDKLFPYTTLIRSRTAARHVRIAGGHHAAPPQRGRAMVHQQGAPPTPKTRGLASAAMLYSGAMAEQKPRYKAYDRPAGGRSEEHTSELQSLMRI